MNSLISIEYNTTKNSQTSLRSYKKRKKYYSKMFEKFPIREQLKMRDMLNSGYGVYHVAKVFSVSISSLILIADDINKPQSKMILGVKNESYCSEEELITGFKCSYEDLSVEEKTIWNRI